MSDERWFELGPYTIQLKADSGPFTIAVDTRDSDIAGVFELVLECRSEQPAILPPMTLEWLHPMVNTHLRWLTRQGGATAIMPWKGASSLPARVTSQAPVYALMSIDGTNQLTFAIDDALNASVLRAQLFEEDAILHCALELENNSRATRTRHTLVLRLDTRPLPYSDVLKSVADWWADQPDYRPMPVPEHARLPMYSTWYSFHLGITPDAIETQCRLAKELGMESVIVDDGWQTDDCNRGYAWCGDWDVALSKFPDFAGHVKRVQSLGMKYLLWFSVPFVGIHSKAYPRYKEYLLPGRQDAKWWCLDPRYPEVRTYLIGKYLYFVNHYGIDGLKLDFVDSFGEPSEEPEERPANRDNLSVAEAAAQLMGDVADALRKVKPDIMIEFRQSYIGPFMRRCGNIFRVGDVPNDFQSNRISSLDLRLLSGTTAVHSDMMMWHPEDSVESAALQLNHTLFSVPQVSVRIDRLPPDHRLMLAAYLEFWREHRDVILDGDLRPLQPGMGYPLVTAATDQKYLAAVYAPTLIALPNVLPPTILIVNGTMADKVWFHLDEAPDTAWTLTVHDCCGRLVGAANNYRLLEQGSITVPQGGVVRMEKEEGGNR